MAYMRAHRRIAFFGVFMAFYAILIGLHWLAPTNNQWYSDKATIGSFAAGATAFPVDWYPWVLRVELGLFTLVAWCHILGPFKDMPEGRE